MIWLLLLFPAVLLLAAMLLAFLISSRAFATPSHENVAHGAAQTDANQELVEVDDTTRRGSLLR